MQSLLFLELPLAVPLPPGFCLHSESEPIGPILEWNAAYKSPQSIGPVRVSEERAQNRTAEELPPRSNLWRDRDFPQPAVVLPSTTAGVINTTFKCQGKMLCKEDLRPGADRHPLIPTVLRVAIPRALKNENWHDGKPVIRLKQHLLREQKSRGAVDESSRVIYGCAEVAGRPRAILDAKHVISAVPFQSLMAYPHCIAVTGWNDVASGRSAASACGEIKPSGKCAAGCLHIIETHVNIAFRVVAVLCLNVRTRSG